MTNPYAVAAPDYFNAGWKGTLPVPYRQKRPPPDDFTGIHGLYPDREKVEGWAKDREPHNVILRMPTDVIGIDVDAYPGKEGAETLEALENELGALPPTFVSTARDDGVSGIRFYRVPPGIHWVSDLGPGIEIIQRRHRFALVSPSVHPSGRPVCWFRETVADGEVQLVEATDEIPAPAELTWLSEAWQERLRKGSESDESDIGPQPDLGTAEVAAWLSELPDGDACRSVERQVAHAVTWFAEHGKDGAYDHMNGVVWGLVRDARDGHPGVASALAAVQRAYLAEVADRRNHKAAEAEWQRSLSGAVAKTQTDGIDPSAEDPCGISSEWSPTVEGDNGRGKLGQILSRSELARLPKPEPLISDLLSLRSYVLMVGKGGTNKTFTALAFACCVATGTPWLGRSVETGALPVIYVVGEGAHGLDSRIAAWEEANKAEVPDRALTVLKKPDSMTDKGFWSQLTALATGAGVRLVVFDTLSSLAPDADETKDAPVVTRRLSDLASDIDGTAMLLHHTGWGPQDRARGGSQLEHNADEVLVLQRADEEDSHVVSLRRKKVKDGPDGETVWLRRVDVRDSCVLELTDPPEGKPSGPRRGRALRSDDIQGLICQWIGEHEPNARKQIVQAVMAENGVGRERVEAAFAACERANLIESRPGTVVAERRGKPVSVKVTVWRPGSLRVKKTGKTVKETGNSDESQ